MTQKSRAALSKQGLLDQNFWRHFAQNIWEKKPLLLKNAQTSLRELSESEIFDLLVLYSDRCRQLNDPEGFKFYIDGFKVDAGDVLQVLPEKADRSLVGYHDRMRSLFSDYCLVCDELLQVNLKKQHLLQDFTDELYRHVGFPNRFSEMGLYLGNYRKTPFGVHVDSCGVFSFPVVGRKKFRLWTSQFARRNPGLNRAFKYDSYKKSSKLLEAGPGDMTYWPSSAWHIAESDGSFSATWSLGVWVDQAHKDKFSENLKNLLGSRSDEQAQAPTIAFKKLHSSTGEIEELPQAYRQSIKHLRRLSELEMKDFFLKEWMRHISLQGFKTIPRADFKITAKTRLKLRNDRALILWQRGLKDQTLSYSFGGVLVENPSRRFLSLIQSVNAGKTCLVRDFLQGTQAKKDLVALQALANAGAFA